MKNLFFTISIVTLLILGCTTSETKMESIDNSANLKALIKDEGFISFIKSNYDTSTSSSSRLASSKSEEKNGNGVMVIKSIYGTFFGIFSQSPFGIIIVEGENADVKILKNGTAIVNYHTNHPTAWFDDFGGGPFLSNFCYDIKEGQFNFNISGIYEKYEDEWGTAYYFSQYSPASANVMYGRNIKVNNAYTYDEETWEPICNGDATMEKTISMKFIINKNGVPVLSTSID